MRRCNESESFLASEFSSLDLTVQQRIIKVLWMVLILSLSLPETTGASWSKLVLTLMYVFKRPAINPRAEAGQRMKLEASELLSLFHFLLERIGGSISSYFIQAHSFAHELLGHQAREISWNYCLGGLAQKPCCCTDSCDWRHSDICDSKPNHWDFAVGAEEELPLLMNLSLSLLNQETAKSLLEELGK